MQKQRQFSPKDIHLIHVIIKNESSRVTPADYTIKNIRVSNTEVQFDLFISDNNEPKVQEDIALAVARTLENEIGNLRGLVNLSNGLTVGLDEYAIIQKVIQSFNAERYWEAQETAETLWNRSKNPDKKNVIQGLILVGAALVHHQRNEDHVCLSILKRALLKLEALERIPAGERAFLSIDIESLLGDVKDMVAEKKARDIKLTRVEGG